MARRVYAYRSVRDPRSALRTRMRELAQVRVRYGYRRIGVLLHREGWRVGPPVLRRIYGEEGLVLRPRRPPTACDSGASSAEWNRRARAKHDLGDGFCS